MEFLNYSSVPITGGTALSLNSNATATTRITRFSITPDSSRVLYAGDILTEAQDELFMVSIIGGQPTRLNSNLVEDGEVVAWIVSPDSSRVIYLADQLVNSERELFSVPITGGTPVRLLPSMVSGGGVRGYRISPDGQRVVYLADRLTENKEELFSVPIAGGVTFRLSPNLIDNGDVQRFRWEISSDSQRVVFRADHEIDDVINLFSTRINQGSATRLNPVLSSSEEVSSFAISPDGTRVVYSTDWLSNDNDVFQLWSVPIAGGTSFRISATSLFVNSDVAGFKISPDSQRVVYRADTFIDDAFTLFSTPILGPSSGDIIQLMPNLNVSREVFRDFEITPDNQRVIYRADSRINDVNEIFSVPLLGGPVTRLNRDLPFSSDIDDFLVSPNSDIVIYQGDADVFDESELFAHRLFLPSSIDDESCFPIKAENGNVALVCL